MTGVSQTDHDIGPLPPGPRPGERHTTFFDDPVKDHLLRAVITLACELSVTRERMASLERLLAESGALDRGALDRHRPDTDEGRAAEAARQKLIADLIGPLMARLAEAPSETGRRNKE